MLYCSLPAVRYFVRIYDKLDYLEKRNYPIDFVDWVRVEVEDCCGLGFMIEGKIEDETVGWFGGLILAC